MKINNKKSKMKYSIIFVLATLLFNAIISQARTISLDDAIKLAIENNRDTKIALMEVQKAGAAVDEAFGYALPSLDLSGTYYYYIEKAKMPFPDFEAMLTNASYGILFKEEVLDYDKSKFLPESYTLMSLSMANNYEAKAQVSQILFNSAVFRGIGATEIYLETSKENLRATVSKTVFSVKQAFFAVLLTKSMLEITKASIKNGEDNLKNVKAYYQQGLVSEYDLLQAEIQVENLRPSLFDVESQLKVTSDGLKMLLGIDPKEEIDFAGELIYHNDVIPEENGLIKQALDDNFELSTLKYKKQVDEAYIDLNKADYWPSLAAFANYSFNGASDTWDYMNYKQSMVGLSFSMNLFNGNKTKKKVEQSTIVVKQTEEQIFQLEDYIKSQIKSKIQDLKTVKVKIETQEKTIQKAQKAYDIATVRFKEGTGIQLEIQNADLALYAAKTNMLNSVFQYMVAKAEIDKLLGQTDKKYLEPIENKIKSK